MATIFECLKCGQETILKALPAKCPKCGYGTGVLREVAEGLAASPPRLSEDFSRE
jgi:Zn finger protein HypA/HybF involved in hydrogenase expression